MERLASDGLASDGLASDGLASDGLVRLCVFGRQRVPAEECALVVAGPAAASRRRAQRNVRAKVQHAGLCRALRSNGSAFDAWVLERECARRAVSVTGPAADLQLGGWKLRVGDWRDGAYNGSPRRDNF